MRPVYWGEAQIRNSDKDAHGEFVQRDGETYYRISNYHEMEPFFLSVVSGFDHWLFVSSKGGLTCGRKSPENALFPYYTDDKIHDASSTTGPLAILLVEQSGRACLWKPFNQESPVYEIERNLYKNRAGNKLIFEEINKDLELVYSYAWMTSERFGFVKKSLIRNLGSTEARIEFLDGLRNVLPFGVPGELQSNMSTLLDAYKQAERIQGLDLALFTMSSILTDRAEPSEALKATVVWSLGLDQPCVLLSEDQVDGFGRGKPISAESFSNGKRGAFFVQSSFTLSSGAEKSWLILADINQGPSDLPALFNSLRKGALHEAIAQDVESGTHRLRRLVGSSDGFQCTSDALVTGRHFSNTLYNIMRGGTFYDDYHFPQDDFLNFLHKWNEPLWKKSETLFSSQEFNWRLDSVVAAGRSSGDADLERIALEYLPLTFSRRHGDPSRPWNHFSIDIWNPDGSDRLNYQGNWRDIFQNWEALALSFPGYIESFLSKFVNASTADGYNPYRISKDGFDWEVLDAEDPWSNIGYWGDHQVNYLLSFLELSRHYHPGKLSKLLSREIFVFADVPYRLKGYQDLVRDPRDSVIYDEAQAAAIAKRVSDIGSDGRLVCLADGSLHRVNLLEKLLVSLLVKIGNFVPGGGIWMNTQRPEWNDANNALVGFGLSMVTLCYLRRYLALLADLLSGEAAVEFAVSNEVVQLLNGLHKLLISSSPTPMAAIKPEDRKAFMDEAGALGTEYRESIYLGFTGKKTAVEKSELLAFVDLALNHMDHSIAVNQRSDGLYHSYNLVRFGEDGYDISHLYEMLEGQVAVLKSGFLTLQESVSLLDDLRNSRMYRPDQNSYMLYPVKKQQSFLEKNVIPPGLINGNPWIQRELESGRTDFVEQDVNGNVHFNGRVRNSSQLGAELLATGVGTQDVRAVCEDYDTVFDHRQFTGRSGSMYKYEGLGCIYWHMVSKLLLATSEVITQAAVNGADADLLQRLFEHFDETKEGLGLNKTPSRYGAFPIDPYSHTPAFNGVQQPGMTGQVKEDVITRFRELGVDVENGQLRFAPVMLKRKEFLSQPATCKHLPAGADVSLELEPGSLAFGLCGIPVIYRAAKTASIQVHTEHAEVEKLPGNRLGRAWSRSIFKRERQVLKIIVDVPDNELR